MSAAPRVVSSRFSSVTEPPRRTKITALSFTLAVPLRAASADHCACSSCCGAAASNEDLAVLSDSAGSYRVYMPVQLAHIRLRPCRMVVAMHMTTTPLVVIECGVIAALGREIGEAIACHPRRARSSCGRRSRGRVLQGRLLLRNRLNTTPPVADEPDAGPTVRGKQSPVLGFMPRF